MTTSDQSPSAPTSSPTAISDEYLPELLANIDPQEPLRDDASIVERVAQFVQTAFVAQWWLLLLDPSGVQEPTIPRIERPHHLGEREVERLGTVLARLAREESLGQAHSVVLVWELPDPADPAALIGPSMLAATLARTAPGVLRAQVLVRGQHSVSLWEPTGTKGAP